MQDRRQVRGFRFVLWLDMTTDEEHTYRTEHGLSPEESVRRHLATRVATELDGLGDETGWWHDVRIR